MSRFHGWRAAALGLLVMGGTGCNDGVLTEPAPQFNLEEEVEEAVDVSKVAMYRSGSPTFSMSVSTWIGRDGGTLRLLDFEIVVPAGAVAVPTKFRIKLPGDPKKLYHALAEFQPHNTPFLRPITLRMPYSSTTAEGTAPSVIWWNGTDWVRYQTTLLPDGRAEITTDHFSFFGTELLPPGITPVGG